MWLIEKDALLFGQKFKGVYRYFFKNKDDKTIQGISLGFNRILKKEEMELLVKDPYCIFDKFNNEE